jgi:drug/metabolite transporter (DMT)-like permease
MGQLKTLLLFIFALLLYFFSTIAWIAALRVLPLSQAYVFMSLAFVLVPLGAHFLLGEPLTLRIALGSLIVIAGVLLTVS